MTGKKRSTKKKRGRPATGQDPVTAIRLSVDLLKAIELWRQHLDHKTSRSEFIRWLIDEALASLARKDSAKRGALTRASLSVSGDGPFTASREAVLTKVIKARQLPDGACHYPWEGYWDFRAKNKCATLSSSDEVYAAAYSSCAVPRR